MLKQHFHRGDTLIEVLFALSVFSLVAVGALSIMNQGSDVSARSLEVGLVRSQINAQADTLRFLRDSYTTIYQPGITFDPNGTKTPAWQWQNMEADIIKTGATTTTTLGGASTTCPTPATGSFIMDTQNASYVAQAQMYFTPATNYAQVQYTNGAQAEGIWIEAVRSPTDTSDAYQSHLATLISTSSRAGQARGPTFR